MGWSVNGTMVKGSVALTCAAAAVMAATNATATARVADDVSDGAASETNRVGMAADARVVDIGEF
jgi:hypothetical protein